MDNTNQIVLSVEHLSVNYGHTVALSDIHLEVVAGDYLGIIGPNGGGKSTLLKAILGLAVPDSGEISIFGAKGAVNRHLLGYVPQSTDFDRNFPISVKEVVLSGMLPKGLRAFHRYSYEDRRNAMDMLAKVGITHLAANAISDLSGGEFQRMMIARALATNPGILLLDEPTASVDASSREQIYKLLEELNASVTIILVTHDVLAISTKVKRIACLNQRLIYHGEPQLTESIVQSLYGCPVDLIAHGVPHRVLGEHESIHAHGPQDTIDADSGHNDGGDCVC